jgi:hypothetical protein
MLRIGGDRQHGLGRDLEFANREPALEVFGKLTALQPTTASSDRAVTVAAVGSLHAFRSTAYVSSVETIRATRPQNEKDHRSDRWSQKPQRLFVGNCLAVPCRQLTARRLAGCCRVDARFTLAFWTLALGRWPLDTGPVGPWSPSALVAWGARRFRLGTVRETRSINRR